MRFISYALIGLITPAALLIAISERGLWLFALPALLYLIVPLADALVGLDTVNPDADDTPAKGPWRALARAWVPIGLGTVAYGLYTAANADMLGWERVLMVVDLGLFSGAVSINMAHELMHRTSRVDRALAEATMTSVAYTWFCVEHVHGHHKRVATPDDPASSRLGESLYAFLPRSLVGGLRSAIAFERSRAARRGFGRFDLRNRLHRYALENALLWTLIYWALGPLGLLAFVAQAIIAVLLLETINYLEHYGLARRAVGERNGKIVYERVAPRHSWNSSHAISNRFLANLARHSDHHANANRPYELLRHLDAAPQLPTGYAGIFLLALVPPLFFRVMNPLVAAENGRLDADAAGEAVDGFAA